MMPGFLLVRFVKKLGLSLLSVIVCYPFVVAMGMIQARITLIALVSGVVFLTL